MASMKEIQTHIKSIQDTQKVTNAMYLIASAKMRKAKAELDQTKPYFEAIRDEIKRIFRTVEDVESPYFYPSSWEHELPGAYGYLIITSDKGLAGAYNQNVIKETLRLLDNHHDNKLFVVGDYGRAYFTAHGFSIEQSFLYTAQNPTFDRAREISSTLLDLYQQGELSKIFVIYTDFRNGLNAQTTVTRLLPFHRHEFFAGEKAVHAPFEFEPSVEKVLEAIMPSYIAGFLYSALVDSFCCEQNTRMTAMDTATRNAQDLLDELKAEYNHLRQSRITQEITEISSGTKSQLQKRQKKAEREATDRVNG